MAKVDTYKCDGCGTLKGSLNHWFKVYEAGAISVLPWDQGNDQPHRDLCSDACVIKAVQQWLSAQQQATSGREAATDGD